MAEGQGIDGNSL